MVHHKQSLWPGSGRVSHVAAVHGVCHKAEYSIIRIMKINRLHGWDVSVKQAREIQLSLAERVITESDPVDPGFVAGVDISVSRVGGRARAAVVVLSYPGLETAEVAVAEGDISFPYVPGLLSFREGPLILAAYEKVTNDPELVLVDGQGIAHPRRLGLAAHLGLFLDRPTIGCAKSILCGSHDALGEEYGSYVELVDRGEIVGVALRTRSGVKPIYVSVGHKIDLATALQWVLKCCRGYRLPEPTRMAHLAASARA